MARTVRDALSELSAGSEHATALDENLQAWWLKVLAWPPDVFAVTSQLLEESGAYRRAVSPPAGEHWPPRDEWVAEVEEHAEEWWRWSASGDEAAAPQWLCDLGEIVASYEANAIQAIADNWALTCALIELHATADQASGGFGMPPDPDEGDDDWIMYLVGANDRLSRDSTLSNFSKDVVRVLPKMRTPQSGITLRSMSGYLASIPAGEVETLWSSVPAFANKNSSLNLLLLPLPLEVVPRNFRAVEGPLTNLDKERFGFFEYEPRALDLAYAERMIRQALEQPGGVDGVILPELAVSDAELAALKQLLESIFVDRGDGQVPFLLAGVRGPHENRAHFAVHLDGSEWRDFPQQKHHRWCLDRGQIMNYRIGAALQPSVRWWEDIEVRQRQLRFIVANHWLGICPLICEDLARQDPVAQIIRALGPTLVIALLLDGPQLTGRWPARYATVLADDPGSSVLTFTPLGMAERSVPPGKEPKRVVGLWKDAKNGLVELTLEKQATALLLTLCNEWAEEWMADGRSDGVAAAQLSFGHLEQLS